MCVYRDVLRAMAVAAIALGAAACGSTSHPEASPTTTGAPTTTPVTPSPTTATTAPVATVDVRAYFMQGDTVGVAHRTVASTVRVATAAMAELLAGPSPADAAAGLTTAIPGGTELLGITIDGGTATVDLSGAFESGGGSLSMTARLAQVTYTLTQFPTVQRVAFQLDGQPVTVFGGEGIMLDHPATRTSFESVTPAILVESPGRGWAVHSPLRITGSANVFEAQFRAELTDASGAVLATQVVHATSGTGTRGTFDATLAFSATATGPVTLSVFDMSAKDGMRIDVVTIPLQVVTP
jgi:germination protein M